MCGRNIAIDIKVSIVRQTTNQTFKNIDWYYYIPCSTKFLRVVIFAILVAIFPAIRKNKFPQTNFAANIFPAENFKSRVLIFSNLKYSTKKSCMFNYNLSLSFRNKTVYNGILLYCLKIWISIALTQ